MQVLNLAGITLPSQLNSELKQVLSSLVTSTLRGKRSSDSYSQSSGVDSVCALFLNDGDYCS